MDSLEVDPRRFLTKRLIKEEACEIGNMTVAGNELIMLFHLEICCTFYPESLNVYTETYTQYNDET